MTVRILQKNGHRINPLRSISTLSARFLKSQRNLKEDLYDRGLEIAEHNILTAKTEVHVYFADSSNP